VKNVHIELVFQEDVHAVTRRGLNSGRQHKELKMFTVFILLVYTMILDDFVAEVHRLSNAPATANAFK
jgi:hypothetical protein